MMLFQRKNFFAPTAFQAQSVLATTDASVLGTTQKYSLDRTWPIEEILLHVDVTIGSTATTPRTGSTGQAGLDALLGIVKRVNLTINDGVQPRSVVDFSGIGLLEYATHVGFNLDAATLEFIKCWQIGAVAAYTASQTMRYTIRIPLVHPSVAEPLRTRSLLPVHTYPQDPILTIDFESGTNMYSAGKVSNVAVTVDLIRREMSAAYTKQILDTGGFIPFDLLETPNTIATGVSGEQRFLINTPGNYLNMQFRQYLGGATVSRDVLDQTTTFGSESRWRLETGGVVLRDWRWKQLQVINQWSQPLNGITAQVSATTGLWAAPTTAGSPTIPFNPSPTLAGYAASGTSWQPAASVLLDFLSDGLDSSNELGSLLDCNTPAKSGLRMEVIGPVASVATNGSILYMGGHRLYGDISKYQAVKI